MSRKNPLRQRMQERGVSQNVLARELSISPAHLSRILSGKRRLGIDNAIRIAKILGVPMETFFQ